MNGQKIIKHNLIGLAQDIPDSFVEQQVFYQRVREFKKMPGLKRIWLSQKRQSFAQAIDEFTELHEPEQYYTVFHEHDDVFEVFYLPKAVEVCQSEA